MLMTFADVSKLGEVVNNRGQEDNHRSFKEVETNKGKKAQ